MWLYADVSLMGEEMVHGGLPFLGIGCPVLDVGNIYLVWNIWNMGYCFCSSRVSCKKGPTRHA